MKLDGYCQQWLKENDRNLPKLYPISTIDPDTINLAYPDQDYYPRPSVLELIPDYNYDEIIELCSPSVRDRTIMRLIYLDGYTQTEVSQALQISQPTVSLRHKFIIRKLKKYFRNR